MPAAMARKQRETADGGPATMLPLDYLLSLRAQPFHQSVAPLRGLTHLPGATLTRLRGRGLEFDDLRPYAEGDDVRHIDWKVTARTGRPHTRLYREERERSVTVAVDFRRQMFTGSQRLRSVAAGEIAARIIWAVAARGDRSGVLAFDDAHLKATRPAARERGVLEAIGTITTAFDQAALAVQSGSYRMRSLDEMIGWINRSGRTGGDVLLLTGFDMPGDRIGAELAEAGKRNRLALLLVDDPVEIYGLPTGRFAWRSGERALTSTLDRDKAKQLARRLGVLRQRRRDLILGCGVPLVELDGLMSPADMIARLGQSGMI